MIKSIPKNENSNKLKILLVDGNSFLYRAYFGSLKLINEENPTNAVLTGIRMLKNFLNDFPNYQKILFFFDVGKNTFRHQLYKSYKLTRKKTPINLINQIPIFKNFLTSIKIDFFEDERYEADDLVASANKLAVAQKFSTEIISTDQDLLQLVSPQTNLLLPKRGMSLILKVTNLNFFQKFNLKPEQIPDFKALSGDSSDAIPGIPQIGPKTAKMLLNNYQNLSLIYQNINLLPINLQKKIKPYQEMVFKFQKLTTLFTDIDLQIDFSFQKYDFFNQNCLNFYQKMKLNSLLVKKNDFVQKSKLKQKSFFT